MRLTLLDLLPPELVPPAPPPRKRLRERRHVCGMYVRKVKGDLYQLRPWVAGWGSVNCGLYDEPTAERVRGLLVREMAGRPATALDVWRALRVVLGRLARTGAEVPDVLPMWVERDGPGAYWGRACRGGTAVEVGPFPDPESAHAAVSRAIGAPFGSEPKATPDRPRARLLDAMAAC